jgi:hypothetical protein
MNKLKKFLNFLLTNKVVGAVGNFIFALSPSKTDDALWKIRKAIAKGDTTSLKEEVDRVLAQGKEVIEVKTLKKELKKEKALKRQKIIDGLRKF